MAKKNTAEYEEWLRKYRAKRGFKSETVSQQSLNFGPEFEDIKRVAHSKKGEEAKKILKPMPENLLPKGTRKSVYSKSEGRNLNCEIVRYVPTAGKYLVYREDGKYLYYGDDKLQEPQAQEILSQYTNGKKDSVSVIPPGSNSEKIEKAVAPVAQQITFEGLVIDKDELSRVREENIRNLEKARADLKKELGEDINPNSTRDVQRVLFEKLGLPRIEGNSTAAEVLERLTEDFPDQKVTKLIQDIRSYNKLETGYLSKLQHLASVGDGRLRNMFSPATVSGRYSTKYNPVAVEVDDSVKTEDKIYFHNDLEEIGLKDVCPIK